MAEVEYGGVKLTGSKLFMIIPLVSMLGGGLWAGFEFYKDYLNMKEKVETYVSPDLSDYDKRIDLSIQKIDMLESEMKIILDEVTLVSDVAKDMKNDLKTDVRRIENIVEDVEQRVKEDSRENAKDLKFAIKEVKEKMQDLENRVDDKIQKALENPLANMRKN